MKATCLAVLLLFCGALTGCQSETDLGSCIGAFDRPDPRFEYRVSKRNVILGFIFIETIIVPAVVLFTETHCPETKR